MMKENLKLCLNALKFCILRMSQAIRGHLFDKWSESFLSLTPHLSSRLLSAPEKDFGNISNRNLQIMIFPSLAVLSAWEDLSPPEESVKSWKTGGYDSTSFQEERVLQTQRGRSSQAVFMTDVVSKHSTQVGQQPVLGRHSAASQCRWSLSLKRISGLCDWQLSTTGWAG